MLDSLFSAERIKDLILLIPVILLSISFHEYAHAWMADRLGDPTARYEGRLTLNPFKHFNVVGFLMMVIVRFGWATPVPINPNNFKNPSRGILYTALSGPVANLILAVASSLVYVVTFRLVSTLAVSSEFWVEMINNGFTILVYLMYMNIGLAIFNLIPIYPLDGSRILGYFLPVQYHNFMAKYGQYVQIGFVLLIVLTTYVSDFIGIVQSAVAGALLSFWDLILSPLFGLF